MTTLLAIATATDQIGVALAGPDGPLASLQVRQGRRHGELLAPAIETLTGLAGIRMSQVGRVAVDIGPGPLHRPARRGGHREGVGGGAGDPDRGVLVLELLAYRHRREGRPVAARGGRPAGRGLLGSRSGRMEPVTEPAVAAPAELIKELRLHGRLVAAGDGAHRYADVLTAVASLELAGPASDHPSAIDLAELARDRPSVPLAEITPLYLRGADVRIGWQQRAEQVVGPWLRPSAPQTELEVHLVPLRRRHLRQVLKIEAQVYPRPWTLTLFMSELNLRAGRHYVAARLDGWSWATAG